MSRSRSRRLPRIVAVISAVAVAAAAAGCASSAGVTADHADEVTTSAPIVTDDSSTPTSVADPVDSRGSGVGDALFPGLGNPGIDVAHYDVDLRYDPTTDHLDGSVTLDLAFTDARDEFRLDSEGPEISAISVDGAAVLFRQDGADVVVRLPFTTQVGQQVSVRVEYADDPRGGAGAVGLPAGWFNTPGGSYVLNEPDGAHRWLPCNDHPSDKATYTFHLHVPAGLTAVANGGLESHTTAADGETWVWQESQPMATYLIQVLTGDYELIDGTGPHGLPLLHAVLRGERTAMQPFLDVTAEQVGFFEQWFGPYPLDRYGLAITDSAGGLAMETQERSMFSRDDLPVSELRYAEQLLLSHELAHQWFGDAVSPARWRDIWLNESFATYGQWMWLEHAGLGSVEQAAQSALGQRGAGSSADPTVDSMFAFNSYDGGAVVLQALRNTVGDDDFFTILRQWVAKYNGTSRTTQEFIALAEDVTGRDLGSFFDTWLFATQLPARLP